MNFLSPEDFLRYFFQFWAFRLMVFSLIIPTYNNREELLTCLESLKKVRKRDFEVWVCIDGSTDGTAEAVEKTKWPFPVKVLHHSDGANHGRAAARNLALPNLTGKYILFMDSDMQADPGFMEAHLAVLKGKDVISIGHVAYRNLHRNVWAKYISERGVGKFRHGEEVPYNYFIAPNTALPASWVKEAGGFDGNISGYGGEDMELGYRLFTSRHPKFIYNRDSVVFTVQEKDLKTALSQLREYGGTGLRYVIQKWPDLSHIYWVDKCASRKIKDRLFQWLMNPFFKWIALNLIPVLPYGLKKPLINYLVLAHVHEGYRSR